ncbi:hypothetical protein P1P75_41670, partial [Streptomyces sp. ID05-39B]|uniref:hypothetical protein n=1 Tax=Streptomyces sp. ID05-39B TaxID=3028664 RepID=UPI0029B6F2FC
MEGNGNRLPHRHEPTFLEQATASPDNCSAFPMHLSSGTAVIVKGMPSMDEAVGTGGFRWSSLTAVVEGGRRH